MSIDLKRFLDQFPPKPQLDASPLERARHHLNVYRNLEIHYPAATPIEIRNYRRNARQNLRRVLTKHPELLTILRADLEAEARVESDSAQVQQ